MNMINPKVSIIIPVYNISEYVDACVKSACEQSYENIEIILVDDGSRDNSGVICDEWKKKDARIKVIHKKNGGLSSARNAGLDIATGDYIYFLDGDDYIDNRLIENVVQYMNQGYDMVVFSYSEVYSDGTIKPLAYHDYGVYTCEKKQERIDFLTRVLLSGKIGWDAWSRIFRRDIVEKIGLRFADNNKIFAEDLYFSLCYCAYCKKILSITSMLYFYRKRDDSIMVKENVKINLNRMNELGKAVLDFYSKDEECDDLVKIFAVFHYMIMKCEVSRIQSITKYPLDILRVKMREDIKDIYFFEEQMKKVKRYKKILYKIYSPVAAEREISVAKFYLDGNFVFVRIRNKLIKLYEKYIRIIKKVKKRVRLQYIFPRDRKRIYFIGTEDFGNLGDNQITEATYLFLKERFADYEIIEVSARNYYISREWLDNNINIKDVIILQGGGNFGNEYVYAHKLRNDVIKRWNKNVKIIFPQTIFFNNEKKDNLLEQSKQIYTKKNNVVLFTREKKSYEFAKENFSCDSYLVPDIVLYCDEQKAVERKNVVRLCMRNDIEKCVTEDEEIRLKEILRKYEIKIEKMDLQLDFYVSKELRKQEIEKKIQLMRTSKLIITDRLHGMVFAAITGTPCIAFSNYNYKVRGTFEWIMHLPYIKFVKSLEEAKQYIADLLEVETTSYDNSQLIPYYNMMERIIREKC